jgi:hypothetical protein
MDFIRDFRAGLVLKLFDVLERSKKVTDLARYNSGFISISNPALNYLTALA